MPAAWCPWPHQARAVCPGAKLAEKSFSSRYCIALKAGIKTPLPYAGIGGILFVTAGATCGTT